MKKLPIIALALASFTFVACNEKAAKTEATEDTAVVEQVEEIVEDTKSEIKSLHVVMQSKSGSEFGGEVYFSQIGDKVIMEGKFTGLKPNGVHAIHLHENADCSSDDGMSAGGHWNPTGEAHGEWDHEDGFHQGDIGNLVADENGEASLTFQTDLWCIGCDDDTMNIIGTSIIVHEAPDDFVSQPTGDAGGRIGCGVVLAK